MSQAVGDPDELERFARVLQQFVDSLNDAVEKIHWSRPYTGWPEGEPC